MNSNFFLAIARASHALMLIAAVFLVSTRSVAQLTTLYDYPTETADVLESELATDGVYLYGVRYDGSTSGHGSVFRTNLDGTNLLVLHRFADAINGVNPYGAVVLSGDMLYGTTNFGGAADKGVVFKLKKDGTQFTKLFDFGGNNGALPYSRLIVVDEVIYGTCVQGETGQGGNIFRINTDGTGHAILARFPGPEGSYPTGPLLMSDSWLYGVSLRGGMHNSGVIYKVKIDGSGFQKLHEFDGTTSSYPRSGLVKSGTTLYGVTFGSILPACIFSIGEDGTGFSIIKNFGFAGHTPSGKLIVKDDRLYGMLYNEKGSIFRIAFDGSNYETLHSFNGADGKYPSGSLMEHEGKFYGYTAGGDLNYGVLFRLNTDGSSFEKLMQFEADNQGHDPNGALVHAGSSVFGVASKGGRYNGGVIYKMKNDGSGYTLLHNFNVNDGSSPEYSLIRVDDRLYGTTATGGQTSSGTLFSIDTLGLNFEVLSQFGDANGWAPRGGVAADGEFLYGVVGASNDGAGILYKFNRSTKVLSNVFSFKGTDIIVPMSSVIVKDNRLIGLGIKQSGANVVYAVDNDGSDFEIILDRGVADAGRNGGTIALLADTLFVAALQGGEAIDMGTLYRVNVDGTGFKKLKDFNWQVGGISRGEIVVSDTAIYGLLANGGPMDGGVVYRIAPDGTGFEHIIHSRGHGGTTGSISISENFLYAAITERPSQVPYSSIMKYDLNFLAETPDGEDPGEEDPGEEEPDKDVTAVESEVHEGIEVYPNPAVNVLNIVNGQRNVGTMALFDSMGRRLTNVDLTSEVIDVSGLPPGIYTLAVSGRHVRFVKR
ncbi:MAG: T9SS type A sorting domain-containing protein [Chryseolinea sp.]